VTKREVVKLVLEGRKPPYVPWSFGFTVEAKEKLRRHFGDGDLAEAVGDHLLWLGNPAGFYERVGEDTYRDAFGVIWDRTVDKDIGMPRPCIPEPNLEGYEFPNPRDPRLFRDIPRLIETHPDRFRVFPIGFSLYERAWTMRGMQELMMDFIRAPGFVEEFLNRIADYNIAQIDEALRYDIDAVHFGDDWGQQHGLQMGPHLWRRFLKPVLRRMYDRVHEGGKYVLIHY